MDKQQQLNYLKDLSKSIDSRIEYYLDKLSKRSYYPFTAHSCQSGYDSLVLKKGLVLSKIAELQDELEAIE